MGASSKPHTHKKRYIILTGVTRHLIVNQEHSGFPSLIKRFTSMPAVWSNKGSIRYVLCHSWTKGIFVLFSWQDLWKKSMVGLDCFLSVTQFVLPVKTLDKTSHCTQTIYEAMTQNLDRWMFQFLKVLLSFDFILRWYLISYLSC